MMHRFYFLFLISALFFTADPGLSAMEVTTEFDLGNLAFHRDYSLSRTTFNGGDFPWGISVYGREEITDALSIRGGFRRDPVLQNLTAAAITYDDTYFSVSGGPFFGTFNTRATYLKPGLSSSLTLRWPGVLFFTLRADSSIGVRMVEEGDYLQERSDLALGYYIPNAVCRLYMTSKKYVEKKTPGEKVLSSEEYMFEADIHKKNVPYRIILSTGYHQMSKSFVKPAETTTYTVGSIMFNSDFHYSFSDAFSAFVKIDNTVYSFPLGDLADISVASPSHLFRASVGITVNTDALSRDD